MSRCRSFSNAALFRKITAGAVELARDLMSLALLGVQPEGGDTPYNGLYGKAPPKRDMTGLTGVVNMAVKRVNPWYFMYSI